MNAPDLAIDRASPLPAYAQVRQRLQAMIAGWREVDARFPGDEALASMFAVSRVTVRRAIDDLVAAGFLVRRRGVGTFVAAEKIDEQLNAEVDFFDQWAGAGRSLRAKVIALGTRPASAAVAEVLGVAAGTSIVYIERLRLSNTRPIAFDIRYVLLEFASALSRDVVARKSILDVLRTRYALAHVDYRIEATVAGTDERAQHLGVLPGDPVLVRKLYYESADGIGLMCGQSLYRADQVRFAIRLPLDGARSSRRGVAASAARGSEGPDLVHEYRR